MFDNLLESRARAHRNIGGQVLSVLLHAGAIAIAAVATQTVVTAAPTPDDERVAFVVSPPPPPPPLMVAPRNTPAPAPIPLGHAVLVAPIDIPDVLPAIDLTRPITDERIYTGGGAAGGRPDGIAGITARPSGDVTYFAMQVERPVVQIAGTGVPEYPDALRHAMIEGEVRVEFVVDTTGKAEPGTLKILRSPHALFSDAIRKALPRMRFKPAETGAHKVRQVVEMPFAFSIRR